MNKDTYNPKYMIFDLETTIAEKYKRKASPFIKENWVVLEGWKVQGDETCSYSYMDEITSRVTFMSIPSSVEVLVGFNIKFDLLWELSRGNTDLEAFLKRGGRIWDCQYAQYLLKSQHPAWQMCSLNETSIEYGGTPKIDVIKAMWNDGVNTPDIPKDLLIDYAIGTETEGRNAGDVGNTENIYLKQLDIIRGNGMLTMMLDRMEGLLATTFMEFSGLYVDKVFARSYTIDLTRQLKQADKELQTFIPKLPNELEFNWNSNLHKSCLIFGGVVKYKKRLPYRDKNTGKWAHTKVTERWPVVEREPISPKEFDDELHVQDAYISGKRMGELKFKNITMNGELKTRLTDLTFVFNGFTKPDNKWRGAMTDALDNPIYSVGADVIEALGMRTDVPFLAALITFTKLTKEIGTYLVTTDIKTGNKKGMLTCVDPKDMLIHHKLNHVNTITTRLSSSDPNLQNLPRGDKSNIKQLFKSRFENGEMIEADYSQLEVVVQGVLTKDPQLIKDLKDKVDFHCKRAALSNGCTYEEAKLWSKDATHPKYKEWSLIRQNAKIFSFRRAYGAGVASIVEATGMTKDEVEELITTENLAYPKLEEYFKEVREDIIASSELIRAQRDNGSWGSYRRGYHVAPTGTSYSWRSYDAPDFMKKRGVLDQFSQPEIKNYTVQGTGGEVVQCVLGLLIRDLIKKDFYGGGMFNPSVVLCNTVHDCSWYDCKEGLASTVWKDIKPIMESIPEHYNKNYGMHITVPFPVNGELGTNMNNLHSFV